MHGFSTWDFIKWMGHWDLIHQTGTWQVFSDTSTLPVSLVPCSASAQCGDYTSVWSPIAGHSFHLQGLSRGCLDFILCTLLCLAAPQFLGGEAVSVWTQSPEGLKAEAGALAWHCSKAEGCDVFLVAFLPQEMLHSGQARAPGLQRFHLPRYCQLH